LKMTEALKQRAANLGLSEQGMAAYVGVSQFTYRKWASGERAMDTAPRRLLELLEMIQKQAPALHTSLVEAAKATERAQLREKPDRVGKGVPRAKKPTSAPPAPFVHVVQALPDWMTQAT
jgi:transcriptional regulator with XRE-family HTH domain